MIQEIKNYLFRPRTKIDIIRRAAIDTLEEIEEGDSDE